MLWTQLYARNHPSGSTIPHQIININIILSLEHPPISKSFLAEPLTAGQTPLRVSSSPHFAVLSQVPVYVQILEIIFHSLSPGLTRTTPRGTAFNFQVARFFKPVILFSTLNMAIPS